MARTNINVGTSANDGTGDTLRDAFIAVNAMTTEIYGNDFVTNAMLQDDAVDSDQIVDGGVVSSKLENDITIQGNLVVDTNTLYVNSTSNRVGIGTTSPSDILDIRGDTSLSIKLGNSLGVNGYKLKSNVSSSADFGFVIEDFSSTDLYSVLAGASGYHRFLIDGSEAMRIDSSGNVGIGTSSPAAALDVRGSYFQRPDSNTAGVWKLTDSGGTLRTRFDLDSAGDSSLLLRNASGTYTTLINSNGNSYLNGGNVGIGTDSPAYKLDVDGNIRGEQYLYIKDTGGTENLSLRRELNYGTIDNGTKDLNYNALSHKFLSGFSEKMRIDSSGNVGIGTTSPAEKLTVSDSGQVRARLLSTDNSGVRFDLHSYGGGRYSLQSLASGDFMIFDETNGDTAARYGDGSSGYWRFFTNNSERMRITSSGNVGVGTSSPSTNALLDVSSSTKGVLLPRMTTTEVNAISSPENGLTVYNTTLNTLCFYNGTSWQKVTSANM